MTERYYSPTRLEVSKVVHSLGGISSVCRITKKHRNTVSKWCKGEIKIDYANWKLISDLKEG
jgi:hypothetical protein